MPAPDIEATGRFLADLIETEHLAVVLVDPDGTQHPVRADSAARADGFLPVFLEAAEAIWEDATGGGFGIGIVEDANALLGFRASAMADVPFCVVALTMLHAIESARTDKVFRVNSLVSVAEGARSRARVGTPAIRTAWSHGPRPD